MKLPFTIPGKKKEKKEYFLALLLREEKTTAVIFEEEEGKIHVVGEHEVYFSETIEHISFDEWLDALDKAISTAESSLPTGVETQKTIFGVKESWVEETKIKKEYLVRLKKASDALGLVPVGFLVVTEAISHLLQKEEGAPISAIIVEPGRRVVTVSLLRAGRIVEVRSSPVEHPLPQTVDVVLHRFTNYEVLPSRVIVVDGEGEHLAQKFISHSWSKSLPFLHMPKITVLPKGFDARAVLVGAASQMGFEVLGEEDLLQKIQHDQPDDESKFFESEEEPIVKHKTIEVTKEETIDDDMEDGENDQKDDEGKEKDDKKAEGDDFDEELATQDFGFLKDEDIAIHKKKEEKEPTFAMEHHGKSHHMVHDEDEGLPLANHNNHTVHPKHKEKVSPLASLFVFFAFVKSNLSMRHIKKTFQHFPAFSSSTLGNKFMLIPLALLILGIVLLVLYITKLKATVVISAQPKVVEKTQDVGFVSGSANSGAEIAATTVSVAEEGSVTTQATGKKEVGEKAKGALTILSSLTKEQTIPSGTSVTSSNGLVFVLTNEVKIASSSGLSDLKSAKADVTAKDIGKEYNLPSSTKFSVGSFDSSQVEAKNEAAFSGGSKKDVTVITKADLDKLVAQLSDTLSSKAKDSLAKKVSADEALLPFVSGATITKKSFDKAAGDEGSSVTLKGTVTFDGLSYKKSQIDDLAKKLLESETAGMQLTSEGVKTAVTDIKQDKKKFTGKIAAKAYLLPKIDNKVLAKDIAGKSFDEAKEILTKVPQVSDISITLSPNIPLLPHLLPRLSGNITIVVEK